MADTKKKTGKGLDVGTANILSAWIGDDGKAAIRSQRNAFLDITVDNYTKKLLTDLKVQYVTYDKKTYVLGDAAFELANIFNRTTRRPMRDGIISSRETEALPLMRLLVERLLGEPAEPGEPCFFSVPAESIDTPDMDVIYHQGIFEELLKRIGYTPHAMVEGYSVVFSELAQDDFTGIGISCGGGMFNICVAYKAVPTLGFSTSRGGDWIDRRVAKSLGIEESSVTAKKESGIDLRSPKDREEEAIAIYYRNLIQYTLQNVASRFSGAKNMPRFAKPISIVAAGGTSMIGGFIEVFREEFQKVDFPIQVKEIRLAESPFTSVARGCLAAAVYEKQSQSAS